MMEIFSVILNDALCTFFISINFTTLSTTLKIPNKVMNKTYLFFLYYNIDSRDLPVLTVRHTLIDCPVQSDQLQTLYSQAIIQDKVSSIGIVVNRHTYFACN